MKEILRELFSSSSNIAIFISAVSAFIAKGSRHTSERVSADLRINDAEIKIGNPNNHRKQEIERQRKALGR